MHKKVHDQKARPKNFSSPKRIADIQPVVTFAVFFYGGSGGIYFHGEGIPDNQYISSAMTVKTFSVPQSNGHQIVTVAGSAPSGGKITVKVTEGSKLLSAATDNVFDKMTFSGFIVYDC